MTSDCLLIYLAEFPWIPHCCIVWSQNCFVLICRTILWSHHAKTWEFREIHVNQQTIRCQVFAYLKKIWSCLSHTVQQKYKIVFFIFKTAWCTLLVINFLLKEQYFVIIWVKIDLRMRCLWQRITCGSSGWNVRYSWYISSMSLIGLSNLFYHFEIAAFLKNYVTAWMVWMHQDFIFGFNFSVRDFSFQSTQKVLEWILIENSGSKPITTTIWKKPLSKGSKSP